MNREIEIEKGDADEDEDDDGKKYQLSRTNQRKVAKYMSDLKSMIEGTPIAHKLFDRRYFIHESVILVDSQVFFGG